MTIKEIAAILGVSATTVSNVVNGHTEKMSKTTRQRIEDALIKYNFNRNYHIGHRSSDLKLVSVDFNLRFRERIFTDPFCAELLDAVSVTLRKYNRYPVCINLQTTDEAYEILDARNIEGSIIIGFEPWYCERFAERINKPVIFVDCGEGNYDNIGIADYEGGKMITEYMINQGHRKIAFFCDRKEPVSSNLGRFQGYSDALSEHGLKYSNTDYYYLPDDEHWKRETLRGFAQNAVSQGYTAVFVVSDLLANEAIRVFEAEGLRIPDDISVAGFDDNLYARLSIPMLTTVRQPVYDKGRMAVELLMQRIRGEDITANSFKIPVELIVRDSVKNIN